MWVALEALASWLTADVSPWLHATLALVAWDLTVQLWVTHAATRPEPLAPCSSELPRVSVLVAAWNEANDIVATVHSILAQRGVELEVIVIDDGSDDATLAVLREAFAPQTAADAPRDDERSDEGRVRVLARPHGGKGAALEAGRMVAQHPILVTVDADTVLGPGALEALARYFADPRVEAVAGSVVVRDAKDVLSRFQYAEYLETTFVRRGWSALGMLEQVPGAFAALRAGAVAAAGGFPTDSLTEDYEVMFRLYAQAAAEKREIRVPTSFDACAYTEPPRTLRGLARQRTRWFAGFLITLVRHRALLFAPRAGVFGLVRLPIKLVDAVLPPWSLVSLVVVLSLAPLPPHAAHTTSSWLGLALIALRLAVDVLQMHLALRAHAGSRGRLPAREPSLATAWLHAIADTFSYAWLRQGLVLRAYPFALRRSRRWEASRPQP